jgi:MFS family permease
MHSFDEAPAAKETIPDDGRRPWYMLLNRYHWFVLLVASLGWLFDCLDQQLFVLARPSAMRELVTETSKGEKTGPALETERGVYGGYSTSFFLTGWAIGGLVFGMLGDRIGRAKTMMITIILYSLFTGLSALSYRFWDFAVYRFLTGLGVGGEFAVGVALVAEVMPNRARPFALASLQALSGIGNVSAALIFLYLGTSEEAGLQWSPWRLMFMVGALPALLALVVRGYLKEPDRWQAQSSDKKAVQLGSYSELFGHPTWRRHAIVGMLLACAGVIGLWAVGFYAGDLITKVQRREISIAVCQERSVKAKEAGETSESDQFDKLAAVYIASTSKGAQVPEELNATQAKIAEEVGKRLTPWPAFTQMMSNIGAFCGMFGFGFLTYRIGRKRAFAICFVAAFIATATVFLVLKDIWHIFVLVPIMGFCQLSVFAGYAMYFPELFPTRLRSTGTSFCYNVGRLVAATGPVALTWLQKNVFHSADEPLRYAGAALASVFLLGLVALPFLPETKDKPLPE